ncbi:MAG: hypothetical protein A2284_09275 [Deltaproteobacteria bacterium RIFOXYA12_FULL_61_11]|nr:MAG: hypothetical protein A2284_09275 [Deltaproteobacteria bacterium RIFOXYA12_FULL_61_11]
MLVRESDGTDQDLEHWRRFVDEYKEHDPVDAGLLRKAELVRLDDRGISLAFPTEGAFTVRFESDERRNALAGSLGQFCGRELEVEFEFRALVEGARTIEALEQRESALRAEQLRASWLTDERVRLLTGVFDVTLERVFAEED